MHLIKAFTMLDWISSLYTIRMAMKPHCTQLCFLVCKVYQAHLVTGNFIVFQLTLPCLITNCSTYWIWFSKYFTHRNHSSIKVWSFATLTLLGLIFFPLKFVQLSTCQGHNQYEKSIDWCSKNIFSSKFYFVDDETW